MRESHWHMVARLIADFSNSNRSDRPKVAAIIGDAYEDAGRTDQAAFWRKVGLTCEVINDLSNGVEIVVAKVAA